MKHRLLKLRLKRMMQAGKGDKHIAYVFETSVSRVRKWKRRFWGKSYPHNQILTPEHVAEIREKYENGSLQRELSEEYKISKTAISQLVNYHTWKWVE